MSWQQGYGRDAGPSSSSSSSRTPNTLFVVPPPVYHNARIFSHGYPNALQNLKRASSERSRSVSRSHSVRGDESNGEGGSDDTSYYDTDATGTSAADDDSDEDDDEDENRDGYSDAESLASTATLKGLRRRRPRLRSGIERKRATHRELHLQRIYDVMMLSIARRDTMRAFRSLRVLLLSHEWQPAELWRHAVQVATMVAVDKNAPAADATPAEIEERDRIVASKRLAFMQMILRRRAYALQIDLLLEIIPELLILGHEDQAREEIDAVLNTHPYRLEPLLHLYSAMLFMVLDAHGRRDANAASRPFTLEGVSQTDRQKAYVPANLLLLRYDGDEGAMDTLRRIEDKFETVLTIGTIVAKRGRRDIQSATRSRSRSRTRSRSRSKSVRAASVGGRQSSASESEGESARRRKRRRRRRDADRDSEASSADFTEDSAANRTIVTTDAQNEHVRVSNDAWAREMARSYLAVLRAKMVFQSSASPEAEHVDTNISVDDEELEYVDEFDSGVHAASDDSSSSSTDDEDF